MTKRYSHLAERALAAAVQALPACPDHATPAPEAVPVPVVAGEAKPVPVAIPRLSS